MERFIDYYRSLVIDRGDGGGGGSATLIDKNIAENGTYNASDDNADGFSKVSVDVPNSYGASDEGKVVSNGALVAQTSKNVTSNGTVDTTTNNSVTVAVPVPVESKDVDFIDYDGTLLYSYTKAEFLALTEMPANPTHEGLTADGWNWTLADAKAYVTDNGGLVIGQTYHPTDGKMKIYLHVYDYNRKYYVAFYNRSGATATIDWGDGSEIDTLTFTSSTELNKSHTYAVAGDYVISIDSTDRIGIKGTANGTHLISHNLSYGSEGNNAAAYRSVYKIVFNKRVTFESTYVLANLRNLESIVIPPDMTPQTTYGYVFYYTTALKGVVFPSTWTINPNACLYQCNAVEYASVPKSFGGNPQMFLAMYKLKRFTPPVNFMYDGSISPTFLDTFVIPKGATSINGYFFNEYIRYLTVPSGCRPSASAFSGAKSLIEAVLPDDLTVINDRLFYQCFSMNRCVVPAGVTSIGNYAFTDCKGLGLLKMLPNTPPTIQTNTFQGVTSGATGSIVIEVPYSADHSVLEAYKTATNWSSFAANMVEAPAP